MNDVVVAESLTGIVILAACFIVAPVYAFPLCSLLVSQAMSL